ncbi:MAG TPA: UDP-N-acetylmuramoyl-tripeptide--D-alanyl-D-alanine ligase [Candidatus Paceibacterota bacterium]|nr:UDP-N-acetylmuramoyl-tripeptide--D-alanyl-D-alanine ligase [Candidatus Paceibacterota bacterium]
MKNIFKATIVFILSLFARAVVRRYRPHIVMVTGSVGKTSTKDAIATVLSTRFLVRKSEKSFNSGFGVPFTILGVDNPWKNPLAWFSIFKRAFVLLFLPNHYPKMLVLEVGADQPGDLARIVRIAKPDAVVVTRLPDIPVHVEAYTSPEAVREEEFSPAYSLHAAAPLIISADDPYAIECSLRTPARVLSYGTSDIATVQVTNIGFYVSQGNVAGMQATVTIQGQHKNLVVRGSVGTAQVLPAAAALTVALAFDIPPEAALTALEGYEPPPGRGRLLTGKNDSIIIDDSYNASPIAVEQALATLKVFPNKTRRIAVLGDMLELGRYSVSEHERIAVLAQESADIIIAVGIRARAFALPESNSDVLLFDKASDAIEALRAMVQSTDVVLIKGSQSIRTEHIVKALLANPADVVLLVRQEKEWEKKS